MEDELSEVRLEASRLKAELVSEKSASHVKVSELQSRINEVILYCIINKFQNKFQNNK